MNKFTKAILNILKRGGLAFTCYPVSMAFAAFMAGLSIWMVYAEPDKYQRLLVSLQITFVTASLVGIALSVLARRSSDRPARFAWMNLLAVAYAGAAFSGLYLVGGGEAEPAVRMVLGVVAAGVLGIIAFLVIPTYRSASIDYNRMFFMTFKSFFIATLYTGVLMGGLSFVAFAVQKLLWNDMEDKIYIYIVILSLLIGYAFFLGYFPNFRREEDDAFAERAEAAYRQPRFAEVLFQNIMVPIHSILSVVLLIWSVKIVITRVWPAYAQVIGIFTAYSLFSILLYILVSSYDTKIVKWYKTVVPPATLVFLGFEVYPIYTRLAESGLKPPEYAIICVWLFAAIVSACFLFVPVVKNRIAAYVAAALVVLAVLPYAGAMDASYFFQSARLRSALQRNEMLSGDTITPSGDVGKEDKAIITEACGYLYNEDDRGAPKWLASQLRNTAAFYQVFGFNEYYRSENGNGNENIYHTVYVSAASGAIAIKGYEWVMPIAAFNNTEDLALTIGGTEHTVTLHRAEGPLNTPRVSVSKGEEILVEADLKELADEIYARYSEDGGFSGKDGYYEAAPGELCMEKTGGGITLLVEAGSVSYSVRSGEIESINIELRSIYLK